MLIRLMDIASDICVGIAGVISVWEYGDGCETNKERNDWQTVEIRRELV